MSTEKGGAPREGLRRHITSWRKVLDQEMEQGQGQETHGPGAAVILAAAVVLDSGVGTGNPTGDEDPAVGAATPAAAASSPSDTNTAAASAAAITHNSSGDCQWQIAAPVRLPVVGVGAAAAETAPSPAGVAHILHFDLRPLRVVEPALSYHITDDSVSSSYVSGSSSSGDKTGRHEHTKDYSFAWNICADVTQSSMPYGTNPVSTGTVAPAAASSTDGACKAEQTGSAVQYVSPSLSLPLSLSLTHTNPRPFVPPPHPTGTCRRNRASRSAT